RVLDLAVARQRGVVVDAQPLRRLELGLVVVADAALGHQPGRFRGQALPALAGAGLRMGVRVLACVGHGETSACPRWTLPQRAAQKMSKASSSLAASSP